MIHSRFKLLDAYTLEYIEMKSLPLQIKNCFFSIAALLLFPAVLVSQSVAYPQVSFPVTERGIALKSPFAGGLNNPQLSKIDINLDGVDDLFIFDRSGNVGLPFIFENGSYRYAPEYIDIFPQLNQWVAIKDYNKDGVPDIFASSYAQGPQGVEVYNGTIENGRLKFTRRNFAGKPSTMLNIPAGSSTTHLPVDYIDYPAFVDVDGDGDLDILSFGPNSGYLYWYRNMASENNWSLDSLRFRLQDYCWGKFFESGFSSEVTLSDSPDACAMFHPNRLEPRHAGSTVLAWDLNGNGLKDLLIGDVGNPNLVLLKNTGTATKAHITEQEIGFPNYDVPANFPVFLASFAIDYDNDGDRDFLVAPNSIYGSENKNVIWQYENVGTEELPSLRFRSDNFIVGDMIDVGFASAPALVDYNGDGLLDLVIGSGGYYVPGGIYDARLFLYENIGTKDKPEFELVDEDYLGLRKFSNAAQGSYFFTPTFGDVDNDGDLDVIVGEIYGKLFYGENVAGPGQPIKVDNWVYNYMDITVRSYSAPFLVDLNKDGLLDLVIGARQGNNDPNDKACSNFYFFQNIGTAENPMFDPNPDQFPNTRCLGNAFFRTNTVSPYGGPVFYPKGDDYIFLAGNDGGEIRMYTDIVNNIYGDFKLESEDLGALTSGHRVRIALADLNDDKQLEIVAGNYRGGLQIYQSDLMDSIGTFTKKIVSHEVSVFPNPVSQGNTILIDNLPDVEVLKTIVYNNAGNELLKGAKLSPEGILDIGTLLPGSYFVSIILVDGSRYTGRFIISY
jgi:hypothetical protein